MIATASGDVIDWPEGRLGNDKALRFERKAEAERCADKGLKR
jgi:hypothetical protein